MAWTLHLLAWITVVASAYKYPTNTHQYVPIPFEIETQESYTPPDCGRLNQRSSEPHDSRMNERSIAPSNVPKVQEEVRVYQSGVEEVSARRSENGSSKILNSISKPGRRRGQVDSNQITFPGPTATSTVSNAFNQDVPEACRRSTYCEHVPNYPQQEINDLILELGDEVKKFTVDKLDIPATPEITQRLGPTEENISLCKSTESVVYPQKAVGADGKWWTLINPADNLVQGFRVEVCQPDDSPCLGYVIFTKGYTGRCQQKYVYRTAAVVDIQDGTPKAVNKDVRMPSCCSCVARAV